MKRYVGTTARGLRTPIFNSGDNLEELLPEIVLEAAQNIPFEIRDRDVLCITESVVARTQGNYATVEDIRDDLINKLPKNCETLGLIFPILSRNRFSILLKGIALAAKKLVIMLSYPSDEVGNALFDEKKLMKSNVNPWQDVLSEEEFNHLFGKSVHPFTSVDYLQLYHEMAEEAGEDCEIIFANHAEAILDYTPFVISCDIHSLADSKRRLKEAGAQWVIGLDEILNEESNKHGYNQHYGLLGSNKADEERIKLFPRDCQKLVEEISATLFEKTGKHVEVMVYGDGAFKDPVAKIWELADPVVSPAFTKGLTGTPNELKLKYLADSEFKGMSSEEQKLAIESKIQNKDKDMRGNQLSEGTTPRNLTDLLGSLADLTSGSGDKGTPVVYIQGYFDSFADS